MRNPLETEVISWVRGSSVVFNNAIRAATTYGEMGDWGYSNVNGRKLFTAESYCEDGVLAYGLALPRKYPYVENLREIQFMPKAAKQLGALAFRHSVLGLTIGSEDFFIDPTYGQIVNRPNQVLIRPIDRILTTYKPREVTLNDIKDFAEDREDLNFTVVDGSLIVHDFDPDTIGRSSYLPFELPKDPGMPYKQVGETTTEWLDKIMEYNK